MKVEPEPTTFVDGCAESVPIEVHVRDMPDRLRYLARHWDDNDPLSQLGVMLSLRMLADEIEQAHGFDGGRDA